MVRLVHLYFILLLYMQLLLSLPLYISSILVQLKSSFEDILAIHILKSGMCEHHIQVHLISAIDLITCQLLGGLSLGSEIDQLLRIGYHVHKMSIVVVCYGIHQQILSYFTYLNLSFVGHLT